MKSQHPHQPCRCPVSYSAITAICGKKFESISCVANWSHSNSRHSLQTDHKAASCQILTDYKGITMICGSALWSRTRRWSCPCASHESKEVWEIYCYWRYRAWIEYIDMTTEQTARESVDTITLSAPWTASSFRSFFRVSRCEHSAHNLITKTPHSPSDSCREQGIVRFLLFTTSLAKGSALGSRNALGQGFGRSLHYYGKQGGQSIRKSERVVHGANTAVNVGTGRLLHGAVYRFICTGITRSCSGHLASTSSRVKRN